MRFGPTVGHAQIGLAQANAQHARDVARKSEMSSDKTQKNVERLYLVVHAMWELLKDKAGLTDADLEAKVQEIDMRDGRLDGQDATQTSMLTCRNCGRAMQSGQLRCPWCGAQADGGSFNHVR